MIRGLIAFGASVFFAVVAGTALFMAVYDPPASLPDAAAVIVLSAGATPDGRMDRQTAARTQAGIAAYRALAARGAAPVLVLSGGGTDAPGDAKKAPLMAAAARAAGVPETDLVIEGDSGSTLQNALFSRRLLGEAAAGHLIVVTSRFHLPRSWASFVWAGMSDITLLPPPRPEDRASLSLVLWEGVKWPVNILRGGAYLAARATGVETARFEALLY